MGFREQSEHFQDIATRSPFSPKISYIFSRFHVKQPSETVFPFSQCIA